MKKFVSENWYKLMISIFILTIVFLIFLLVWPATKKLVPDNPPTAIRRKFVPGYYIINSTAQYAVALPSGVDFYADENGCMHQYEELKMKAGEVVIAFELSKGKYYCFDPNGRMVVFQGQKCLTKAPMVDGAGVGELDETISLIDGSSIDKGAYYWIMGQNISNSTVKIQVADGKTYDVPQGKITLYGAFLKNIMKTQIYVNVED